MPVCPVCLRANPTTHHFCSGCGQKLPSPLESGTVLDGRYEVNRVISAGGGFATTYVVTDRQLFGQIFALKELRPDQASPKAIALFEREARTLAALCHPGIPKLHARFVAEGRCYLVQDFVDGESWAERTLRLGPQPEPLVVAVLEDLLEILGYLHRHHPPIVHRDVKPGNLMVNNKNRLFLIDFGAVRELLRGPSAARNIGGAAPESRTVIYTEGFAPPEQLGGSVTPSCDLYAAGATALALLTARHPKDLFDASKGEFRIPVGLSPNTRDVLGRLLAFRPEDRFLSARHALDALASQPPGALGEAWDPYFEGTQAIGQLLAAFQSFGRLPRPEIAWTFCPPFEIGNMGNAASPVAGSDGTLYWVVEERVTDQFATLPRILIYALSAEGRVIWERRLGEGSAMARGLVSAIPGPTGVIVHQLEAAKAMPWWVQVEGTESIGSECFAPMLACLDSLTGQVRWKTQLTERIGLGTNEGFARTPPILIGNHVWCGFGNRICCLGAADGSLIESLPVPDLVGGLYAIGERRGIVGLGRFAVEALELVTPRPYRRWAVRPSTAIVSAIVAPSGVAVGSKDGLLRLVDPVAGIERWCVKLGRGVAWGMAVSDSEVLVSSDGKLYSLTVAAGELRWVQEIGPGPASWPALVDGKVVVAVAGRAVAHDLVTGAKTWDVTLKGQPLPGTSVLFRDAVAYIPTTAGLTAVG